MSNLIIIFQNFHGTSTSNFIAYSSFLPKITERRDTDSEIFRWKSMSSSTYCGIRVPASNPRSWIGNRENANMSISSLRPAKRWVMDNSTRVSKWRFHHNWSLFRLGILGTSTDNPAMCRARESIIQSGGVAKVRIFTRIFLAQFGLFPWGAVPTKRVSDKISCPAWNLLPFELLS